MPGVGFLAGPSLGSAETLFRVPSEKWERNSMLILTRRAGEAILIDGGVRIVVLGTDGGGVRLGIEAPPSVGIVREEVLSRSSDGNAEGRATRATSGCQGITGTRDEARRREHAPRRRESGEEDAGPPGE
jgi:carbon storage regulator